MKKSTVHIATTLQLIAIVALFSTAFMVNTSFFNHLISAKQYGVEVVLLLTVALLAFTTPFNKKVELTKADLLVILFAIWNIVSELILNTAYGSINETLFNTLLWGTVYLLMRQQLNKQLLYWGITTIFILVALTQATLGLAQLYRFTTSYHTLFSITGIFHNPGPFAGFVVSALPITLALIMQVPPSLISDNTINTIKSFTQLKHYLKSPLFISTFIKAVAWIAFLIIALVLPPTQSRAAWIAGGAGCFYVLTQHVVFKEKWQIIKTKFLFLTKGRQILTLIAMLVVVTTISVGLYTMKKDSADGRRLIWKVTTQLIKQKPIIGHGTNSFSALYMNEQANWFAANKNEKELTMVAGTPEAPFNEALKLWLEKGAISIIIVTTLLYLLLSDRRDRVNKKTSITEGKYPTTILLKPLVGFKGALIALLTFGLFSYPFDISTFMLQLICLTALLANKNTPVVTITQNKTLYLTLPFVVTIVTASALYFPQRKKHYQALKTWKDAERTYNYGDYPTATATYGMAFNQLKADGLFLQMYGKALSMNKQYKKSNEIMALAQKHLNNQIIQNTLGDNYKQLGNYKKAEEAYLKSSLMNPSLLLPKYLLAMLYNESNQTLKARQTARDVLNSPIKVKSSATKEIIREMRKITNNNK